MKKYCSILIALIMSVLICSLAVAEQKKADLYKEACEKLSDEQYTDAAAIFSELGEYEDASLMAMYCLSLNAAEKGEYSLALNGFIALDGFRDSNMLMIYFTGLGYEKLEQYEKAEELLLQIPFFKDVNERIITYPEKINIRDYNEADKAEEMGLLEKALSGFKALGSYSDSKERAAKVQEKINERDYTTANDLEEVGKLEEALEGFLDLGNYKDSADRAKAIRIKIKERDDALAEKELEEAYKAADKAEEDGDYAKAYAAFVELGDYKDSVDRAAMLHDRGKYAQAMQYAMNGEYDEAYNIFNELGEYEDSAEKAYITSVTTFSTKIIDMGQGTAAFEFHGKLGLFNMNTNAIIAPCWDSIGEYNSYNLAKVSNDEKYGYIDRQGNIVIPCDCYAVSSFDSNGICSVAVLRDDSYYPYYDLGLYDKDGNPIIDPKYKTWKTIGDSRNNSWGGHYNSVTVKIPNFSEGKIKVENVNGKWGFLNLNGSPVGQIRWDVVEEFKEGMAAVQENGLYGYIDTNGSVVIEPQYQLARSFSEGQAWVQTSNGLWQSIDMENNVIIDARYDAVNDFENGMADVMLAGVGWQIIDKTGILQYFISDKTVQDYENAKELMNNGEYKEAYDIFKTLVGYKDSSDLVKEAMESNNRIVQESNKTVQENNENSQSDLIDDTVPVEENKGRKGILSTNANFRTGPSRSFGNIRELKKEQNCIVLGIVINEYGEEWAQIEINGIIGYTMAEYIEFVEE